MSFASVSFLLFFLVVLLLLLLVQRVLPFAEIKRRIICQGILLIASYVFYGWWNMRLCLLLMGITWISFFTAVKKDEKHLRRSRISLLIGVGTPLAVLGIFKYYDFFVTSFCDVFHLTPGVLNLILPVGISFYTFQGISYIADVYRGKITADRNLLNYAVYISMFPQLIAGPIVTYDEISDRLYKRKITAQTVLHGVGVFIFGLGLKVLLANPLGKLWSQAQSIGFESLSTPLAWMSVIAFSLQLYFDFFGYSLMAEDLGEMLGFTLPKNFKHPYVSVTMTEFWRRWHITLGRWFRDYVYIPLGGNRKGTPRTTINLLIVWLLTGLWHGAGYNYLLWGLILFLIILSEKLWTGKLLNKHKLFGHVYMVFLIPLTWTVFAVNDITQLGFLFTRLFPFFGKGAWSVFRYDYLKYLGQYYLFFIAGIFLSTTLPYKLLKKVKSKVLLTAFLLIILGGSLYCMYRGFDDPFLYFRF